MLATAGRYSSNSSTLCLAFLSILTFVHTTAYAQRVLLQRCSSIIPGCASNFCERTLVGTKAIAICPACDGLLYERSQDGTRCDCKRATYADCSSGSCKCSQCPPGFWCNGGLNAADSAIAVPCGPGLTTRPGIAASRSSQCVLLPGWGWPSRSAPSPVLCPIGSYSIGGRSSRTPCTKCPSGLTTKQEGSTSRDACLAGPGLYLDMGVVKPCPAGTYQPAYTLEGVTACMSCATGVTTANSAAVSAAECEVARPGYGITACDAELGCEADLCSIGQYNAGGPGSSSCNICPWGLTTREIGSSDESLCRVPPGHGIKYPLPADRSVSAVKVCSYGYNPGWNRQTCTSCGHNIVSLNTRTTINDCYVLKGQGLQMMTAATATASSSSDSSSSNLRAAVDCWPGSVGMSEDTPMLSARPCDTCPRYMTTEQPLSSSKSACKAYPGYSPVASSDPLMAAPCALGYYKSTLGNDECSPCPSNTNTLTVGSISAANCTVCQPGWGGWSSTGGVPSCSTPCEPGTYNDGTSGACMACGLGMIPTANASSCEAAPLPSPSPAPTASPSPAPTASPSPAPTAGPSPAPTASPSPAPTASLSPAPTASPSPAPIASPSPAPIASPSPAPTPSPSPAPTASPSPAPTASPSPAPTASPSPAPTPSPSPAPTASPSPAPTPSPSPAPTKSPSPAPTPSPSPAPIPSPSPLPQSSNCSSRPLNTTMVPMDLDCPTINNNNGGSWDPVMPDNNYNSPPGCMPPNGGCDTASGQFWTRKDVGLVPMQVQVGSKKGVMCYCPQVYTKGHVIRRVNAAGQLDPNGKLDCVPGVTFLPDRADQPTGSGVWTLDTLLQVTCNDLQSCWDMCFFCDGSRRYWNMTASAGTKGARRHRKIASTLCGLNSCPLAPEQTDQVTFAEACDSFAGKATREQLGNLPLVNGMWPYRPAGSLADVLVLAQQMLLNGGVDQGQDVLQSWSWVISTAAGSIKG